MNFFNNIFELHRWLERADRKVERNHFRHEQQSKKS